MPAPKRRERSLEFDFERSLDAEGHGTKVSRASRRATAVATLAALALVVGGGAAVWRFASNYNPLNDSDQARAAGGQIAFVQQAVSSVFAGSSQLDGLDTALLIRSGQLPSAMIEGGRIRHAYRGDVLVGADPSGGYWIAFEGVPAASCPLIASMGVGPAMLAVTVTKRGMEPTSGNAPLAHDEAVRACGRDGAANIAWRFR